MYQLFFDGEPLGPVQDEHSDAVHDAIETGLATPDKQGRIVLHSEAEIRPVTLEHKA